MEQLKEKELKEQNNDKTTSLLQQKSNYLERHNPIITGPSNSPGNLFADTPSSDRTTLTEEQFRLIAQTVAQNTVKQLSSSLDHRFTSITEKYESLLSLISKSPIAITNLTAEAKQMTSEDKTMTSGNNNKVHASSASEDHKYMKQIVDQTLKAVVPFEVGKARQDGTVVKTFFRQLNDVFEVMELGDTANEERKKTALLKSKISDTQSTTEWYTGIMESDDIPKSIKGWRDLMEEYFDVTNLVSRARTEFKLIEMKNNEKASTFVDRFKTARLKADQKDNAEMAERLVDALNESFTTLLLNDPEYKILRKRSTYTSEDISKLLRGIQLDQDTIEKKKQRSRKDPTKVANATATSIPERDIRAA